MIMKTEKKFTWCVRYYNIKSCRAEYRVYFDWTESEIDEFISDFLASHKGYFVRAFKQHKVF